MKNFFIQMSALLVSITLLVLMVTACSFASSTISTIGTSELSIVINNTTGYELSDITLTYNGETTQTIDSINNNLKQNIIIPTDQISNLPITSLKISCKTANGAIFSNYFRGILSNTTILTIYLDEEMNFSVSSNIE